MKFSLSRIKSIFWNTSERRLRSIWRLSLYIGGYFLFTEGFILFVLFLGGMISAPFGMDHQPFISGVQPLQFAQNPLIGFLVISGLTCLGALAITCLFGKFIDYRKLMDFGIKFSRNWWMDFIYGILLGAILMGLIFLLSWLTGMVHIHGFLNNLIPGQAFGVVVLQSLLLLIFAGVYEEIVFRGYLLINLSEGLNNHFLGKTWALIISMALTSLVFGLFHMDNPNATWISTINIMLAGVFLGIGMFMSGSLAIPIGLHISWNFFQGVVFGFPVSGMNTAASLIVIESSGPEWLTGGAFGPEGGLLGLIAILFGSVLTVLWVRGKGHPFLNTDLAVYEPECR